MALFYNFPHYQQILWKDKNQLCISATLNTLRLWHSSPGPFIHPHINHSKWVTNISIVLLRKKKVKWFPWIVVLNLLAYVTAFLGFYVSINVEKCLFAITSVKSWFCNLVTINWKKMADRLLVKVTTDCSRKQEFKKVGFKETPDFCRIVQYFLVR